ncbi:MAG TPA: SDR family NAD(P)-dependent oxidoreductase [Saprospiraceae bacterium]|nr:SDR family NAD(P)-dependent oxidoreductase [Saprospiraceae bacterium]
MSNKKVVFITGISSGIGYDATRVLLENGFQVIGTVRKLEDKDQLLQRFTSDLHILIMDVTNEEKLIVLPEEVSRILKGRPLAGLVNNAGLAMPGPMRYLADEDFAYQMEVNVMAVRKVTNALLPFLGMDSVFSKYAGKIINISSISGLFNSPFNGAYCISKHALESMNEVYRRELLPFGIDVVSIQPGPIKTAIWKKNLGKLDKYQDTEYGDIVGKADRMIENSEKNALPVEVISTLILKILQSSKPRTQYLVHKNRFMFRLLTCFVPDRWVDRMIWKKLKGGDSYRPV